MRKKVNREALESLLEKVRSEYPDSVHDGIVNYCCYENTNPRILWILKEVYGEEGEAWDLREFLSCRKCLTSYSNWQATYGLVVKVSQGILSGFLPFEDLKGKAKENIPVLRKIAVINVGKRPGKEKTPARRLREAFERFGKVVLKQVELIDPDIIIGGSTLGFFYEEIGVGDDEVDKSDPKLYSAEKDGRLWLAAYHTNVRRVITHQEYYDGTVRKGKPWLERDGS